MASSKHLFSLFIIFGLNVYVNAAEWITYRGSGENNLFIPSSIPENVHDIYLDYNLLETIDSRYLNFSSLVYLNLSHNVITELPHEAFINVKKLEVLDLSYNKISGSTLTAETFKKLESLQHLILKGNPLGIIKHEVFLPTYFSRLHYAIDFSECSIHTIETNSLVYLDKLNRLDLSRNNISELQSDTFLGLYSLQILNLSHNWLSRVSTRMFNYLNVSAIDLSSNKISILEDGCFDKIKDLQFLDLSNNRLATQPKDQFGDRFLAEIDLSQNIFETFDTHLLSPKVRKYLRVLRITNSAKLNRIVSGKGDNGLAEGFENLREIYLNDNGALTNIEPAAFSSSSRTLKVAHMTNTMLEVIPEDMLAWENLTSYYVSTANLKCDCHARWILEEGLINKDKAHLVCNTPAVYKSMNLFHLHKEHLVCSKHDMMIFLGSVTVVVLLVSVIFLFAYWLRRRRSCPTCGGKHIKHGKYMSVYTKDVDEPVTHIVDDKAKLVEAVDV